MSHADSIARLQRAVLPAYPLETIHTLHRAGHQAFLVGGCVRDVLRGHRPKDFDVATSARPEQAMALFPKAVPTGIQHGTITVVTTDGPVEVTTFRGEEGYRDGRRPDRVHFLDQIEGDLARRDFTINAMAFDPDAGRLVDPHGGARDLEARVIRCVGDPDLRFGEDGLRPLRAVRFASVLRFEIDPATLAAVPRALAVYQRVAKERVADELRKLLQGPRPSRGIRLLLDTGLAERIVPWLADEPKDALERRLRTLDLTPPVLALRLAALFAGHAGALEGMRLPNALRAQVASLDLHRAPLPSQASDVELRRFASRVGPENLGAVLALQRAAVRAYAGDLGAHRQVERRLRALLAQRPPLSVGQLAIDGAEVARALGTGPGPVVGQALEALLEAVLEDPALNTREQLLARVSASPPA